MLKTGNKRRVGNVYGNIVYGRWVAGSVVVRRFVALGETFIYTYVDMMERVAFLSFFPFSCFPANENICIYILEKIKRNEE